VFRAVKELRCRTPFHDVSAVQHHNVITDVADHGEVVRDKHHRQAKLLPQPANQVQNLRLNRHVEGGRDLGEVVGSFTGGMATRKLLVNFTGQASHAAGAPEAGRNALIAAATAATGIMGIPRFSTADTRLNVGTLNGGDGVNIVPSSAVMTCEARATDDDVVEEVIARIRAVIAGASLACGVEHDIAIMGQSATVKPDEELIDLIMAVAEAHPDVRKLHRTQALAGSDDANLMIRHVQQRNGWGAYIMVGAASPGPHHSAKFDADEAAIPLGIDLLESLLREDPA
jgi:aminobenzoyl-glutamate utilization protein A